MRETRRMEIALNFLKKYQNFCELKQLTRTWFREKIAIIPENLSAILPRDSYNNEASVIAWICDALSPEIKQIEKLMNLFSSPFSVM